jgi:hypothetical protein
VKTITAAAFALMEFASVGLAQTAVTRLGDLSGHRREQNMLMPSLAAQWGGFFARETKEGAVSGCRRWKLCQTERAPPIRRLRPFAAPTYPLAFANLSTFLR